jgi:hypothetical protein
MMGGERLRGVQGVDECRRHVDEDSWNRGQVPVGAPEGASRQSMHRATVSGDE